MGGRQRGALARPKPYSPGATSPEAPASNQAEQPGQAQRRATMSKEEGEGERRGASRRLTWRLEVGPRPLEVGVPGSGPLTSCS